MFPLLQIRIDELPVIPEQLKDVALWCSFTILKAIHLINLMVKVGSYGNMPPLKGLSYCQQQTRLIAHFRFYGRALMMMRRDGRMRDIIDLSDVNGDQEASDRFHDDFKRYRGTKVGGYPMEIQHGVGIEDFVSFRWDQRKRSTGCGRIMVSAIFTNHRRDSGRFRVSFTEHTSSQCYE